MLEDDGAFVDALLWETHARLAHFAETGEIASIDLGGLPMSGRDREALDSILGRGEVSAAVEVAGRSEVWETGFSSVWRVRHFGDGTIAADLIEITSCPSILAADRRDADNAARRLAEALEAKLGNAETLA
ncbi:hydrogenase expression/formation C-terminal domain-containing protein [Rhodoblastus sp. 17X3]|uniref:hydrogenase expression/formation C-terminal domain-containing protein n=1 Tax=Rhodoblastus sp. 17X3 TaxID=3047026 RepID=UPI0024B841BF|nr:hydrogenase expression/formation C-terminal domain-containing protein [Rhodoblastus sp. 17X3]MDI9848804.1 hydrogenase expression/formation C-terminal domain-containing protein [Rhodoblastus sp. 17X3]